MAMTDKISDTSDHVNDHHVIAIVKAMTTTCKNSRSHTISSNRNNNNSKKAQL